MTCPAEPAPGGESVSSVGQMVVYFAGLGTWGFGGPIALAGYMHRDLVERRGWVSEDDYRLALALAQIMPGPLAAQLAIAIGYFRHGFLGATAVGVAFTLPSFVMVVTISWLYVWYGGLWWVQALFYGIGAAVIAVIAVAAYRLARSTNGRDPLLWSIFGALAVVTLWAQAELAEGFIVAGLVVLLVRAPPRWVRRLAAPRLVVPPDVLVALLLFFAKAGAFVFGSGLAIVPFLHQGVVQQFAWLSERQFLDAVAVAMITPGPVVITVAFIGYLVAGLAGATAAAAGIFLPVYLFTVIPAPWFRRHRDDPQLKAFVQGATAAATGAIAGAVVVLAARAIVDLPTAGIALASFLVLWRVKVPEPLLVVAAGAIGLALWPLVHRGG